VTPHPPQFHGFPSVLYKEYRSLGGEISYLLDKAYGQGHPKKSEYGVVNIEYAPEVPYSKEGGTPPDDMVDDLIKSEAPPRDKGDVLADIRQVESKRDEELRYCQDKEESKKITDRYAPIINKLWVEYREL
jgi:hypothetical protein